jgi:hypothetical protein
VIEGEIVKRIRKAVSTGKLAELFSPKGVNAAVGIDFAGVFLLKCRVGNPGIKGRKIQNCSTR